MNFISTPWPNLHLYARDCGEIDPYNAHNTQRFRGEEAFAPEVEGWRRWSKPSPEPRLDAAFEPVLLEAIEQSAPIIKALAQELARQIIMVNERAPVLVAILRAGVPICALVAPILEAHYREPIPICAFSLFYGLGWDEVALEIIVADFPERDLIFIDGWTSGGGVATQLQNSFADWLSSGHADFTRGRGPQFGVLCDPRGVANYASVRADLFVPSAAFTAPETLGFSRGFAFEDGALFGVYRFPQKYRKPLWIEKWLAILGSEAAPLSADDAPATEAAPPDFRVHVNEVTRALINRDPQEIWLRDDENTARNTLVPLLYLVARRKVPVGFGRLEIEKWGAIAVAKMR